MIRGQSSNLVSVGVAVTTTSETTCYVADGPFATITSILAANTSTAAHSLTVKWRDSSAAASYSLLPAVTVPANSTEFLEFEAGFQLNDGDEIRVTAGTASVFDVMVTVIESIGRSG